jgi:transcription elongation factor GreA
MVEKETLLTPDGLVKLEKELEHLKTVKRREIASRIKQALEFGDISENSEYDDAKNEQAFVEGRIITLEKMLRNARIIDSNGIGVDAVTIGSKVKLKDLENESELEYIVVGSAEADPSKAKISNESPVGKAIMGQPVGAIVEVHAPVGIIQYQIMEIQQ